MAVARCSWLVKTAIAGMLAAAAAYAYASYRERKRLEAEIEPMNRERERMAAEIESAECERRKLEAEIEPVRKIAAVMKAIRETPSQPKEVWLSFSRSYYCRVDNSHVQRLERAKEKDPAAAGKMRGILEKMIEIDKKGIENNRRIEAEKKKADSGVNAAECYNQAEMLALENEKLVRAWLSLLERFTLIEDAIKIKDGP